MSIENATLSPIEVGIVLASRLRVEEVLAEGAGYTIIVADNHEHDELVVGRTPTRFARAFAETPFGPSTFDTTTVGSRADISLFVRRPYGFSTIRH
jgi:hypothetical protein